MNLGDSDNGTVEAKRRVGEQLLSQIPELSQRILSLREAVPGYEAVPPEVLRPANEAGLRAAIVYAFISKDSPSAPLSDDDLRAGVELRLAAGVGVDAAIRGAHVAFRETWSAALDVARRLDVDADALHEAAIDLWDFAISGASSLAEAYRALELERAGRDREARASLLHDLFMAEATAATVSVLQTRFGFAPDRVYRPFRARPISREETARLEQCISFDCEASPHLVGFVAGDVAGLSDTAPFVHGVDAVVGVGPAANVHSLSGAFRVATRALETAVRFGSVGVFDFADLLARPAVVADAAVGDELVKRFLGPLDQLGPAGLMLERTLRIYFANDKRIAATARALEVHPNTVKYRLQRYSKLAGVDLDSVDTVVALWWALERTRIAAATSTSD